MPIGAGRIFVYYEHIQIGDLCGKWHRSLAVLTQNRKYGDQKMKTLKSKYEKDAEYLIKSLVRKTARLNMLNDVPTAKFPWSTAMLNRAQEIVSLATDLERSLREK